MFDSLLYHDPYKGDNANYTNAKVYNYFEMATTLDIYNISERFFVLKILDLYYMNSIDSYRVRYNNANTRLNEFIGS